MASLREYDLMRTAVSALLLALAASPVATMAQTPSPAAAPAAHYSSEDTDLGTLLDDPAAKAVLAKYVANLIASEQIDMARGMTLKTLQGYASDTLSDKQLALIDADLAKLPAKK